MPEERGMLQIGASISEAIADLESITDAWKVAKAEENRAGRSATDLLNRMNEAQKHLDSLYAELKAASRAGDWNDRRRTGSICE